MRQSAVDKLRKAGIEQSVRDQTARRDETPYTVGSVAVLLLYLQSSPLVQRCRIVTRTEGARDVSSVVYSTGSSVRTSSSSQGRVRQVARGGARGARCKCCLSQIKLSNQDQVLRLLHSKGGLGRAVSVLNYACLSYCLLRTDTHNRNDSAALITTP